MNENIYEPQVIILGIFGNTNKISEDDIRENTLTLLLQELERVPDKILIPAEGKSSIYIQEWAEMLKIKTQVFQADWVRNGKIAAIIRDDRISKECTHALVFLSPKSTKLEKMAEKLCKKGKFVFTSSHNQILTQFELLHSEPLKKASEPVHKLNTGKVQSLLKFQMKEEY